MGRHSLPAAIGITTATVAAVGVTVWVVTSDHTTTNAKTTADRLVQPPDAAASATPVATSTFVAIEDTYLRNDTPTDNFGAASVLIADDDPASEILMKFIVSGIDRKIVSAKLRLRSDDLNGGSDIGGTLRSMTDTSWSERTVTWNVKPPVDGPVIGSIGKVISSTWYTIDVTSAVTENGLYSFALSSSSTDGVHYDSRETGANPPQLVVSVHSGQGSGDTVAPTPPLANGPPAATLVGAGDIAMCSSSGDERTAELLAAVDGVIFTAGDNSQDDGSPEHFRNCFGPSWGMYKDRIKPVPGNHDYVTPGATGYFGYFGDAAGRPGEGYYSYDLGNWHIVALNSNCDEIGGCEQGSNQERWLRDDLASSTKPCTAAYWHHPLFTSSHGHDPETAVRPLFQALYDFNAELVLSGHTHVYERFAPQDPMGTLDLQRGIRQFVVGTGGGDFYEDHGVFTVTANSEVRQAGTYGVLQLTLRHQDYDWRFLPVQGQSFTDAGSGVCH